AVVHLAVAAAVVDIGAEGRDLDDLAAEHDVREAEAAADQAAVAEQLLDLFGRGVGGDVEILGRQAGQQAAHGAADQAGAMAGLVQAVEHAHGVGADGPTGNRVLVAGDDPQRARFGRVLGRHQARKVPGRRRYPASVSLLYY